MFVRLSPADLNIVSVRGRARGVAIIYLYLYVMTDKFLTYLRAEKRYSENTLEAYERDIGQFLAFLGFDAGGSPAADGGGVSASSRDGGPGGDCPGGDAEGFDPSAVTTDDIRSWIQDMSARGLSATSINRKTTSLRSFFRYLRKTGAVKADPFRGVGFRKVPARLPGFVPESKMDDILGDLEPDFISDDYTTARDALLIVLLYTTGLRVSELCDLRLGDFSQNYSELRVRGKGNKERVVPVLDYTREKIVGFIGRFNEWNICKSHELSLFLSEDGSPVTRSGVYNIVSGLLGREGVQGKRSPHVLRHTFATHMMDGGADIREIQEILGHNSLAATQVYTHNSIAKLKQVYNKAHPRCRPHAGEEEGSKDNK